jgi:ParB-like chromosome segregation protein Spo0J
MPENKTEQLTLPYEVIDKVANRTYLRDNFKRGNRETYHIPEELILEREGFNDRIDYEGMEELRDSLLANGLLDALVVDVLPDGRVLVDEGYRRIRGIRMAKQIDPTKFATVECFVNSGDVTELQRTIRVHSTNCCRELLKPVERANNAYKIKFHFGKEKTNEEVSKLLGNVSRQTVDNLIKIAMAPDDIKNQIRMAGMNITEAMALVSKQKKLKKDADKVEEDSHKNTASPTPLPYDPNAEELMELKLLEEKKHFNDGEGDGFIPSNEEPRISNHNPDNEKENGQPLNLVGNTVATNTEKTEKDDSVKFDESREEVAQIQNCIKLADRLENIVSKIDCPDGTKKDVSDVVKWLQKDLAAVREWISKNKKQNKAR